MADVKAKAKPNERPARRANPRSRPADAPDRDASALKIIDCAVHPQPEQPDDIRSYMTEPWKSRPFPRPERYYYPVLTGEFMAGTAATGNLAGSDPARMADRLFDKAGVDAAVLIPLTRGLIPEVDLGDAICRATNDWLADRWLGKAAGAGRFHGAIRVNPGNPEAAVAEIERLAPDRRFVAIAVPMQSHHPYGQRQFFTIWEAAARHHLPVIVKLDGGSGVDFWPTAVGHLHHYIEYSTLAPLNFAYHLISFIAEGVFDRLPELRVIFADGGHDMLAPLIWRMDKNWRPTHREMPWSKALPSSVVKQNVRFCTHALSGPDNPAVAADWLEMSGAASMLMYASRYPYFDYAAPADLLPVLPAAIRDAIIGDTAREVLRIG
ncbi:MAG: amidohydrolase family protein [Hyphomicrobiaceae bacterium]